MKITVAKMRDLEKQVLSGEISYSRMIEIINESFGHAITDDEIKKFATEAVTMDGRELNETRELVAKAVQQGAEWARWRITGLQSVPASVRINPTN